MPPITLQRSRAPAALLVAAALGAALGVIAFGRVRVAFVMAPPRAPAVAEVTPPAVRPCLATRDTWFSGHDRPRMVHHRYDPMQWYEVADDCRGQAVTLAATDRVRVVIADGESARTVTLPLAVPQQSGHHHFELSAGIDLLVHDGTIAVVGHAAEDRHRLRAMLSDDGGWTWTARDLGSIPRSWLNDARFLGDGTLQWRIVGSRDWKS